MATEFRVGDEVMAGGRARVVTSVSEGVLGFDDGGAMASHAVLLRRPLLVGDTIRIGERIDTFAVEDGLTPGITEKLVAVGWTHDDGTPIVPWSEMAAALAGVPRFTASVSLHEAPPVPATSPEATAFLAMIRSCDEAAVVRSRPIVHPRWSGTLTDWRALIDEHRPAAVSAEDIVRKLAESFGIVRPRRTEAGDRLLLARSLFRTDPDVVAFVERVADESIRKVVTKWNAVTMRADVVVDMWEGFDHEKVERAMQTAWDRDENGWASRAKARAEIMAEWLAAAIA